MKKITLSVLFFLLISQVHAQKITFLFSKNGKKVYSADSAYFTREITPLTDSENYRVVETYSNGNRKLEAVVSKYNPSLYFDGLVKQYYENGNKREEGIYYKNKPLGEYKEYYMNGQLKEVQEYLDKQDDIVRINPKQTMIKMLSYFDSTGVQLVKDGTGTYKSKEADWITTGFYKDGVKDSVWTGLRADAISYIEHYKNGKFLGGILHKDGSEKEYAEVEKQPEFPGGMKKFYEFIGKEYRIPREAISRNAWGRVIVSFVVEKDGTITDAKVVKEPGSGTGEEALRVLAKSKNWLPGEIHGLPVRVSYTLPIMLTAPIGR